MYTCTCKCMLCTQYSNIIGIVFDSLEGDDLEYTLRLRHEVGEIDTWHTSEASFWFQRPGARVTDKWDWGLHVRVPLRPTLLRAITCLTSKLRVRIHFKIHAHSKRVADILFGLRELMQKYTHVYMVWSITWFYFSKLRVVWILTVVNYMLYVFMVCAPFFGLHKFLYLFLLCTRLFMYMASLLHPPSLLCTSSSYLTEGFLHLQNRVAQALVEWKTQPANLTVPQVQISVKPIPYPSYRIDRFLNWNAAILPLLLIMAFIYSAGMFTKVCSVYLYIPFWYVSPCINSLS